MSSYSHLSARERDLIDRMHNAEGLSARQIALRLGRDHSTVSRELKRGLWFASNENESYRPYRPKRLKTGPWTAMRMQSIVFPKCLQAGPERYALGVFPADILESVLNDRDVAGQLGEVGVADELFDTFADGIINVAPVESIFSDDAVVA